MTEHDEVQMRTAGLAVIVVGIIALGWPIYRYALPRMPLDDFTLHFAGALLLIAGGIGIWSDRAE